MKSFAIVTYFLVVFLLSSGSQAGEFPVFTAPLRDSLQKRFDSSGLGGRFGLSLYSSKYNRQELAINDQDWFIPASCLKLLVTAATLNAFPKNTFFTTDVNFYGKLNRGVFTGLVKVTGNGDPNVSARFAEDEYEVMRTWMDSLRAKGIRKIVGNLIFEEGGHQGPSQPSVWRSHYFDRWYGAEISFLSYNDNCYMVSLRPGAALEDPPIVEFLPDYGFVSWKNELKVVPGTGNSVSFHLHKDSNQVTFRGNLGASAAPLKFTLPVRNASGFFEAAFKHNLREAGIALEKGPIKIPDDTKPLLSYSFKTAPVTNIVEEVNQRSQNLHAEILLRKLGQHAGKMASREAGIQVEKEFLKSLGLNPLDFDVEDASGLSRYNRVKPKALSSLLHKMLSHPEASDYVQSLATPGIHGAKAVRLSHLKHRAKIKTGYIHKVQGLSGYLFPGGGDTLSFAMFLNGYGSWAANAADWMDSTLTQISRYYSRTEQSLREARLILADPTAPPRYLDRLIYFSRALEGRPYQLGPTGEGREADIDPNPIVNLTAFDCVTYIETVMGLSMTEDVAQLPEALDRIRYYGGERSYESRKHFFAEDWIYGSPDLVNIIRFPNDTTAERITDKKKFFGFKNLPYSPPNPSTRVSYVPSKKAIQMMENWTFGRRFLGIGLVSKLDWLWIAHTGFLDATQGGRPLFRHASSTPNKVIAEDFADYLRRRGDNVLGVVFFEFKPQTILKGS